MGEIRGKLGLEAFGSNYADSSSVNCKKHPLSDTVGICAYCLKDKLMNLVCSECGEQRISSCSCSDVSSSNRNSCSTAMEVGSVARVSFLIENDKKFAAEGGAGGQPSDRVIFLRRSSSSCVEVKKTANGSLWKIKRLFRRRKNSKQKIMGFDEEKNDGGGGDGTSVRRSRSVCSFRDGGGVDDVYDDYRFSSAKISDVANGVFQDYSENRVNKGQRKKEFITAMDESSSYIDLKLDSSTDKMEEFCSSSSLGARVSSCSDDHGGCGLNIENPLKRNSSCRRRNHSSVWRWISKYDPRKG